MASEIINEGPQADETCVTLMEKDMFDPQCLIEHKRMSRIDIGFNGIALTDMNSVGSHKGALPTEHHADQ